MKKLEKDELKKLKGGDFDGDPNALKCSNGCLPNIPDKCPATCPCTTWAGAYKCLITEP